MRIWEISAVIVQYQEEGVMATIHFCSLKDFKLKY